MAPDLRSRRGRIATWAGVSVVALGVACTTPDPSRLPGWRDPSPHTSSFVTVNDVRLHVLDWGGTGDPLVLIPGSADNPHVYDAIAPQLTDRFRVVSYARRWNGQSEKKGPYTPETFAEDLRQLLDQLGFTRVNLAGWSLGGHELTIFAGRYPERARRLVYLDAGYDWSDPQWLQTSVPGQFQPEASDLVSFPAYREWFTTRGPRRAAAWSPAVEAYARDYVVAQPDGSLQFHPGPEDVAIWMRDLAGFRRDYRAVRAPALAIYVPDFLPSAGLDATAAEALRSWVQREWVPWQRASRLRFEQEVPSPRVETLSHGDHMTFLFTEERDVVRLLREFLIVE
jgi:pimeloyl-ACP methyl ester carboxylesterase